MTEKLFAEYTGIQVKQFRETILLHMANVKKSVAERTHHKRQYDRRMKERQMYSRESKVVSSKALDASLVVTECSETKSDEHITRSSSGTYISHIVDADIKLVNDQVPSAKKDHISLIAQSKIVRTVENADFKAQIHGKKGREKRQKSSVVHEKPNTPRSCLRWKPTGRIFKIAGLRWIPTGKMFTDNTTKVDSEPPNGSNGDITNPYECDQTLNVSAGTTNSSAGPVPQSKERCTLQCALSLEEEKSSWLVPNPAPAIPYVPPTNKELELLFQPMFDEYFTPPGDRRVHTINTVQVPVNLTGPSVSISCDQDAPSGSHLTSSSDHQSSSVHHGVAAEQSFEVNPFSAADPEPFVNVFAPDSNSEASSSGLATDALWCFYNSVLSKVEPKNFNSVVTEDCWFQAMQDEIHEFDRLDVWELVPPPDCAMIIALKWIYKVKLNEYPKDTALAPTAYADESFSLCQTLERKAHLCSDSVPW
ncbi:retrovirus-related pol polyprotein from transposon TNT 1-94 [Tanacetum coccineum]|uniref:Retrovirus-related pol polyprotein from transposon TNT 1-94 n=1 Tax=Tanacetum coccineum TaxID=301880 RepID=A0ABQ5CKN6_9ASTR